MIERISRKIDNYFFAVADLAVSYFKLPFASEFELLIGYTSIFGVLLKFAMSRRCQLTGKKANNGYAVSHSHRRTKKLQQANLQYKRVWWEEGNRWVRLKLSTKAIKTLNKKGIEQMAKDAGIDLSRC